MRYYWCYFCCVYISSRAWQWIMFNTITVLRIKISSYKFQHCGHVESVRKLKSVRCLAVYLAMELRNFSSSCSCLKARTPKTMLFFWFVKLHGLASRYHHLGETQCLHIQDMKLDTVCFSETVVSILWVLTASQPRRTSICCQDISV